MGAYMSRTQYLTEVINQSNLTVLLDRDRNYLCRLTGQRYDCLSSKAAECGTAFFSMGGCNVA